jgi:RNA polymerase sigma factor (sigma-70 family)
MQQQSRAATHPVLRPTAEWTEDDRIDADLMRCVRDRDDHGAFATLLPRVAKAIDGPLLRYLPVSEIDDGRATVHFRIWEKRHRYHEDRGTVRAWIGGGISMHYSLDWLRKRARAPRPSSDRDAHFVADRRPDPAEVVSDTEQAAHLVRLLGDVLSTFPPVVRLGFRMRLAGTDYSAIAAAIGRPVGTVASDVYRVRKKLLARLKYQTHPRSCSRENPMSDIIKSTGTEPLDFNAILAQLGQLKADLAAVKARLAEVDVRLPVPTGAPTPEAGPVPDAPGARPERLRDSVRQMIDNPAARGSGTDLAEILDLAEELDPVRKRKVWLRLKESGALLKKAADHRAAINQLREVERILAEPGEPPGTSETPVER